MAEVWAAQMSSSTDKLVLLALADNANDAGVCWPSVANLCLKTSLAERSVRLSISRLRKAGYVEIKPRDGHSNWFVITPASGAPLTFETPAPDAPLHEMHPAIDAGDPCTTCTTTPASGAPTPASGAPRTVKEPSIEPSLNRHRAKTLPRASSRCPPDFDPDVSFALTEIPDLDVEREVARFRDYEFKTPRKDWPACWRTWIRTARDRGQYAKRPVRLRTLAELEAEEAARNAQR